MLELFLVVSHPSSGAHHTVSKLCEIYETVSVDTVL